MGGRPLRAPGSAGLGLRAPLGLELGAVGTTGWAPLTVGVRAQARLHRWVMSRTPAGAPELPRLMGFFSEGGTPQPHPSSAPPRLGGAQVPAGHADALSPRHETWVLGSGEGLGSGCLPSAWPDQGVGSRSLSGAARVGRAVKDLGGGRSLQDWCL